VAAVNSLDNALYRALVFQTNLVANPTVHMVMVTIRCNKTQ